MYTVTLIRPGHAEAEVCSEWDVLAAHDALRHVAFGYAAAVGERAEFHDEDRYRHPGALTATVGSARLVIKGDR